MTTVDLYGVDIETGAWSWANITRGTTSPRHISFVMAPAARNTFFNGTPAGPNRVHAWGPNSDLLDSSPAQTPFAVVSIETIALARGAEILGRDSNLLDTGAYRTYSGEAAHDMLRRTEAFSSMVRDAGDDGIHQSAATTFRDSAIAGMLSTVSRRDQPEVPVRMRHLSALDIVMACDDFASSRRYQAITSISLSLVAGYSERRIRAAFKEMTGVSPMSYMRARALHEVRRELVSGAAESVTDTAFRWGFTELGRFARAYREQYGELPSATLRTAKHRFSRASVAAS
jgi:AraC-like DNA-binding protein